MVSFKEMFVLDGRPSQLTEDDIIRRDTICHLLRQWQLIEILDESKLGPLGPMKDIVVVPYRDKADWQLCPKYTIGINKKN